MKDKVWNIVIVGLLLLLIWVFTFYWGSQETKEVGTEKERDKVETNAANSIDKDLKRAEYNRKFSEVVKKIKSRDKRSDLEKEEEKRMKELVEVPIKSVKDIEEETEKIYDELLPESFESDVEVMDEALNELDTKSDELNEKLIVEEESMGIMGAEIDEEEVSTEETKLIANDEVPENEEELDVEGEDVNNI